MIGRRNETLCVRDSYILGRDSSDCDISLEAFGAEFDEWLSEVQEDARVAGYLEGFEDGSREGYKVGKEHGKYQ